MKTCLTLMIALASAATACAAPAIRLTPREPSGIFPPPAPVVIDVTAGMGMPPVSIGFEQEDSSSFQPVGGRNQTGSTLSVAPGAAHSGKSAVRVDYAFSGGGFLEMHLNRSVSLAGLSGDSLSFSAWVRGTGNRDIGNAALRLVDARGEVFQYRITPLATALAGTDWQQVSLTIDLKSPQGSWGANADKVLDRPLSFLGIAFDHGPATPARGSFLVDDIRIGESTEASGLKGSLTWRVRDFHNRETARGVLPVAAAAGEPFKGEIRFTPPATGIYYIDAELPGAAGSEPARVETRAAVFTPRTKPVPASPFLWAVASHPSRYPAEVAAREVRLMRDIGFTACRFDFNWGGIQPEAGVYKWEAYDRLIDEFHRNSIMPLPVMGYSTRWASTGDINAKQWQDWGNAPPRIEPWTEFLKASVKRYGDRIKYWEIWNEADIGFWRGTVEQYAELFNASIKAVHSVDPKAKVMNGGFSEVKRNPDFIPTFLKLANPKPDIYAFHTHMAFANLLRASEGTKKTLAEAGMSNVPSWLNEAGYSSWRGQSEQIQASVLVKKMAYTAAEGHEAYVWYDLRNDGNDPLEIEHNWGLVLNDFTPKASMVAAHTLLNRLGGKRFVRRIDVGENLYALQFADDRESVLVAWSELPSDSDVPRLFRTSAATAETVNLMGVRSALPVKGGSLVFALRGEPVFITMPGKAVTMEAAQTPLTAPAALSAAPGRPASMTAVIANPLKTPLRGRLTLEAEGGWRVAPAAVEIDLKPGEKREIEATATAPLNAAAPQVLRLRLSSDVLPQTIEGVSRLHTARVAPRMENVDLAGDAFAGRTPMVHLDAKNTVSLFEATPMQELHFKGPQDLSADVYLARATGGILLGVRVRDDIHSQTETLDEMWKGDSIQFALSTAAGQFYEWTMGGTADGPRLTLNLAPQGVARGEVKGPMTVRRTGDITYYQVLIPDNLPGIKEMLARGGSFSVLVNDNDGKGRKGWVEWTPGIGKTKDATQYEHVVFD